MRFNYDYKIIDERLLKSRKEDCKKLIACKAIVKTDEGYALKITGSTYDIDNYVRQLGDRFTIVYHRSGDRVSIVWDSGTLEFFVHIRYKQEFFSRYVSLGLYPELANILEELMVPMHGYWNWENSENKLTVTKKIRSITLLGRLTGTDEEVKRKINFRDYVRKLDDRVDSVVRLLGREKVWVTWS